jgi:folate-dependent phosphoribosylglycinamide formyltransferase PurN
MKNPRLYIVTINESLYINPIIKWLIKNYHKQIVGISIVSDRGKKQSVFDYYKKIYDLFRFIGIIKLVNVFGLIKLKEWLGFSRSVSSLIKKYNINQIKIKSVNDPQFISKIRAKNIDIIFSFCGEIYKKEILEAVNVGTVNKHCALLPAYGGVYPAFWVLLNNEKETGVTLHLMELKIDAGQILVQKKVPISSKDTMHSIYSKCHKLVPGMIKQVVEHYNGGRKLKMIKKESKDNYYSYPKKEDIDNFYKSGHRMI